MDRATKSVIAATLLIMGILTGTNVMVSDDVSNNWLWWTLLFLGGALFFWWWIRREDRQLELDADAQLKEAERQMEELEDATAKAIYDSAKSADNRVEEALERADIESELDAEDTVKQDEIFEANKHPIEAASDPHTAPEESIDAPPPSGAEVLTGVDEGDPVSEKQVSDATAQKPVSDDVVEVTPDDAEKAAYTEPEEEAIEEAQETIDDIDAAELAEEEKTEIIEDDDDSDADELEADASTTDADEPDDLKIIEGIGPAYERYLNAGGVVSFAQVAEMDADSLTKLVEEQGGRRSASMETWAEQAALAAQGDWDALETLKDELKGGRRE